MGLIPDNTSRLISPDDQRSVAISLMPDVGGCFASPGPFVVPIAAVDTYVDIPLAIGGAPPMTQGESLFWRMDANGQLIYNYAADWPTIVVPPGHIRSVVFTGIVDFDPDGNTWVFAFTLGGVIQPPEYTIDTAAGAGAIAVSIISGDPVDVSLAQPVSLSVKNITNAVDLNLNLISMRVRGGPLA